MADSSNSQVNGNIVSLLGKEYSYYSDQVTKIQKEIGRREAIYITLVTAVITALVSLATALNDVDPTNFQFFSGADFYLISGGGLFGLIIIGIYLQLKRFDQYEKEIFFSNQFIKTQEILWTYIPAEHPPEFDEEKEKSYKNLFSLIFIVNSIAGGFLINVIFILNNRIFQSVIDYIPTFSQGFIILFLIQLLINSLYFYGIREMFRFIKNFTSELRDKLFEKGKPTKTEQPIENGKPTKTEQPIENGKPTKTEQPIEK